MAYDWIWRKNNPVMTFGRLYREAIEICSADLYLRWLTAEAILNELYLCHRFFEDNGLPNAERLKRIAHQEFVRAYLKERRAGLQPRNPLGPPVDSYRVIANVNQAMQAEQSRQYVRDQARYKAATDKHNEQRVKAFAAIWCAVGTLASEA